MNLKARLYQPDDYAAISAWAFRHGTVIPQQVLPQCGVVVEADDQPAAAGFLYQDNSVGVAWLAWLTANPGMPLRVRSAALVRVVEAAEAIAQELNYGVMFTMTKVHGLGRLLERCGYKAGDRLATQYFKAIGGSHGS